MPGDNGGVFISLDAMERQEEEKRAKLQAEEDGKRSAEEALSKVEHASDMYVVAPAQEQESEGERRVTD